MKKVLLSIAVLLMVVPAFAQRGGGRGTSQGTRQGTSRGTTTTTTRPATTTTRPTSSAGSAARPTSDKERRDAINRYLRTEMAPLENGTTLTRSVYSEYTPPYIVQNGDVYILTPTTHTVNPGDQSDSDFFIEDNPKIYPGVLLWADQMLANGDPSIVDLGVGKVDVSLDIDTGGNIFSVKDVDNTYDGIQTAIRTLVRQIDESGYRQPGRIRSITGDYSSTQELAIKANLDVKFAAKFSASMSTSSKSMTISHIDDLSQVYYNVVVAPHNNDYSNLFGPDITVDDIKEMVRNHNNTPIVFVNQMSYGRRLYVLYELSAEEFKLNVNAKGSYSGVSATASADVFNKTEKKTRKAYVHGGDPELGVGMIQNDATVASVLKQAETPMSMSKINQGLPMAYVTTYLGSKQTCKRQTVGNYKTFDYQRGIGLVSTTFRNNASHVAGAKIKWRIDYRVFTLNSKGEKVYYATPKGCMSGYNRWIEYSPDWGGKMSFNLPIYEGEYADPDMHFQLRWKPSGGQDWRNSEEGIIVPKLNDDGVYTIDIKVDGYCGVRTSDSKAPYIHSTSFTKRQGQR